MSHYEEISSLEEKTFQYINPQILQSIAYHSHNRQLPLELVKIYGNDVEPLLRRFEQALELRDIDQMKFLAHRMKGSSLNVGAQEMGNLCAQIEQQLARKLEVNHIKALVKKLQAARQATMLEYQKMFHDDVK